MGHIILSLLLLPHLIKDLNHSNNYTKARIDKHTLVYSKKYFVLVLKPVIVKILC